MDMGNDGTSTQTRVLSFGGSLLFSGQSLDLQFLRDMQTLLRDKVASGNRFVIVVGGGMISRQYQRALSELGATDTDLDWIGIHACRFNAQLVRLLLQDIAHPDLLLQPDDLAQVTAPIAFAGGVAPGSSSDYVSVELALKAGSRSVVNMTNTAHVCDKDPAANPDAQAFDDLTWDQFKALIPAEWTPGLHAPFDPRAAEEAQRSGVEVTIVGKDVHNLQNFLEGKPYVGTRLHA